MTRPGPGPKARHPSQLPPLQPPPPFPGVNHAGVRDPSQQHFQNRLTPPPTGDPFCRPIAIHAAQQPPHPHLQGNHSPGMYYHPTMHPQAQQQMRADMVNANGTTVHVTNGGTPSNGMIPITNPVEYPSPPPQNGQNVDSCGSSPLTTNQNQSMDKNGSDNSSIMWLDTPPSISSSMSSEGSSGSENAAKRQRVSPTSSGGSSPLISSSGMEDSIVSTPEGAMPTVYPFPTYIQQQQHEQGQDLPYYGDIYQQQDPGMAGIQYQQVPIPLQIAYNNGGNVYGHSGPTID